MRFNGFVEEAITNKILSRETFLEDMQRISGMVALD